MTDAGHNPFPSPCSQKIVTPCCVSTGCAHRTPVTGRLWIRLWCSNLEPVLPEYADLNLPALPDYYQRNFDSKDLYGRGFAKQEKVV